MQIFKSSPVKALLLSSSLLFGVCGAGCAAADVEEQAPPADPAPTVIEDGKAPPEGLKEQETFRWQIVWRANGLERAIKWSSLNYMICEYWGNSNSPPYCNTGSSGQQCSFPGC
jgi:hypothetical protein